MQRKYPDLPPAPLAAFSICLLSWNILPEPSIKAVKPKHQTVSAKQKSKSVDNSMSGFLNLPEDCEEAQDTLQEKKDLQTFWNQFCEKSLQLNSVPVLFDLRKKQRKQLVGKFC